MFGFGKKAELIIHEGLILKLEQKVIKMGRAPDPDKNPLPFRLIENGSQIEVKNTLLSNHISKVQGEFTWNKQLKKYEYTDLSRNGSWINGIKIPRGEKRVLNDKDKLGLGTKNFEIQIIY